MTTPTPHSSTPLAQAANYSEQADLLVKRHPDITSVVFLSTDGLVAGLSQDLQRDAGESAAASASSLYSVARGLLSVVSMPAALPRNVTIEGDDDRFIIVVAAGENLRIAAHTAPSPDLGAVVYEIARLAGTFTMAVASRGSDGS